MGHREALLRRFHLGSEDLAANQRGLLSQRQADYLLQSGIRNLLGAFVISLALAAILYGIASKPLAPIQWILAAALAGAALTVGTIDYHRTRLAVGDRRVECLTGVVRVHMVLLAANLTQAQAGPLAYELGLTLAHALVVQQGHSLILDTAGRQPFIVERARMIAQAAGGQLKVVRCIAPIAVRQARLQVRQAGPSQWTHDQTTHDQETAWYAHLPADTLIVASDQPVEDLLAIVLPFVQMHGSAQ